MMGVGAGSEERRLLILSGVAGLVGGALSMACGEYISVSSQRDSEQADIEKERIEQAAGPESQARELEELTQIYVSRGLPYNLARQVCGVPDVAQLALHPELCCRPALAHDAAVDL